MSVWLNGGGAEIRNALDTAIKSEVIQHLVHQFRQDNERRIHQVIFEHLDGSTRTRQNRFGLVGIYPVAQKTRQGVGLGRPRS